jgi:hypothetical protein
MEIVHVPDKRKHCRTVEEVLTLTGLLEGARGSTVVKALCYKSEGRGFETR